MLTYIQTILVRNNFVVMNIPSYVNFYNVQDAVKNPKPKPEGTLEFANTLFGTFMNVDYRNSSAKMVCFYAGKPSEQLDLKENVDYRYRNDAFDLRRVDNPLVENQIGKNDWDKSNKVVGFNVDFGPQNQSIFHGFNISQNPGLATAESLEVLNQMANQSNNRGGATQNTSLYNLYKNRSYSCTVSMMGNAMIQPTMYFNLRHVPMFSGPYMIQKVNHSITPGHFDTTFEGIRQPTASLPKVDNYIQSLKTTLLQSIIDENKKNKQEKEKAALAATATNSITKKAEVVSDSVDQDGTTQSNSQKCPPNKVKNDKYSKFTVTDTKNATSATYKEVVDIISLKTTDQKIRYAVFAKMYLSSSQSGLLQSQSFNYSNTDLKQDWGPSVETFFTTKKYYCSDSNIPYVTFQSLNQNIDFLISRYKDRVGKINSISAKDITKFLILYGESGVLPDTEYTTLNPTDVTTIESNVQNAINVYNPTSGNVTGVVPPANPPAPSTPTTNTDKVLFENSKVFNTYYLQNLTTNSDGSISGDFLVINQGQTLSQDYPAKLYVASTMSPIELDTFIIGKNNKGSFKTQPDTVDSLKTVQNRQDYGIVLLVIVDSFISYSFPQVLLPIGCPDLGWKTNDLIEVGDWDAIKDNICCECYSKPYTGTQVTWKDQTCSKNGTPSC